MKYILLAGALCAFPMSAGAQAIKAPEPARQFTEAEVAALERPDTRFDETPEIALGYDKYFYFHRADTDFSTAFHDISECDALSSGSNFYGGGDAGMTSYYAMQYGVAGAAGGALGSLFADAVFGSAERRKIRRNNVRKCMEYKGYSRYGMERERWQAFHFEEGFGRVKDEKRTGFLMKQALVASGPTPETKELLP